MWALAEKSTLGNVFHFEKIDDGQSIAHCDKRIRLIESSQTQNPQDGYLCARCQNLKQRIRQ